MAVTRLHWPPHGPTRCGREGLERASLEQATTCLVCLSKNKPTCEAESKRGYKCSGPVAHKGLHYCRGVPRWRGSYPGRRELRRKPAFMATLTPIDLKEWRKRLGLSRVDAERALGADRKGDMWGRWENGQAKIPRLLHYIAHHLPDLPDARY